MEQTCGGVTESTVPLYSEVTQQLLEASRDVDTPSPDLALLNYRVSKTKHLLQQISISEKDATRSAALYSLIIQHDSIINKINAGVGLATNKNAGGGDSMVDAQFNDEKSLRRQAILDTVTSNVNVSFDDIAGLSSAQQTLREAIIFPIQYPQLFTGARKPWNRVLLYGPPGTGKSRLAQAVASEVKSTFYCVSSSNLISKFVGESERLIKELFNHASMKHARPVIFIDEIDSICRQRSENEAEHTRRVKTELMRQMEGADTSSNNVFLLCATNCPWELDPAFIRRFQKRIYVPLPDAAARQRLFQIHVRDSETRLSEEEWRDLVRRSDGYSGSDIASLVLVALYEPLKALHSARYWRHTNDNKITPAEIKSHGSLEMSLSSLPKEQISLRPLLYQDFIKAFSTCQKTVTIEHLAKFEKFTSSFGQIG